MGEKTSQSTTHTSKSNPLDTVMEAGQKDPFFLIREMFGLTVQPPRPQSREKVEKLFTCPHKEFEEIANSLTLDDFEKFEPNNHLTWQQFVLILAYARAMAGTLPRRIAVRSGRGTGKSASLAIIIYIFLFVYANSLIAATAPTGEQIYGALWKEAALWLTKMKKPFKDVFEWQSYFIRHKETPNVWYARAKTAENIEALSGLHANVQGSIIDEASAVATEVMEVGWDTMTTPDKVMIATSNPTRTDGWFYDLFINDNGEWVKLVFNAEESPVVDQKKLAVDRELHGRDNEKYRVSVLGEFPLKQTEQDGWYRFFSDKWIDDVVCEEDDPNNPYDYDRSRLALGTDVAGSGGDETVGALRSPRWAKILFKQVVSTPDTVSGAIELALSNFKQLSARDVFYDAFGVGHSVGLKVLQNDPNGRNVTTPLSVGELPEEKEYKERYVNKRAMFYDALRLWGERGGRIQGDAGMKEELKTILAKRTGRDKLQIMSKEEMKKRGHKSPDKTDSIVLSFGHDYYRVIEGLPLVRVERKLKRWERSEEENFDPNSFVPSF